MKKIQVTLVTLLLTGASLCAQTIGEKELNDIKGSFQKDASTKAIQNVLTNDKNIRDNALNREIQGKIDHYFKYRVKVQGITDQQSSGRCWMFTSMNVLRPSIIEKYNLTGFDFSHNYLYFWDMFEKSNLFLENMIATANKPMDDRDVTKLPWVTAVYGTSITTWEKNTVLYPRKSCRKPLTRTTRVPWDH